MAEPIRLAKHLPNLPFSPVCGIGCGYAGAWSCELVWIRVGPRVGQSTSFPLTTVP